MKFKIIYTSFALLAGVSLLMSNSNGRAAGGGGDSSGGPNSGGNCGSCHAGGAYNPRLDVAFLDAAGTNPVTSWLPGVTYTIRVQVVAQAGAPVGYGFQMSDYTLANANLSRFAATGHGANVQISTLQGRKYAEHNTRSASNTFLVKWTAPAAAGAGTVRFYVAGNAVNGVNGQGGDSPVVSAFNLVEGRTNTTEINKNVATLRLAPNVANASTELRLINNSTADQAQIRIVDLSGRVLDSQKWAISVGENRRSVDVSGLAAGFYVVQVVHTGGVVSQQLLKQ